MGQLYPLLRIGDVARRWGTGLGRPGGHAGGPVNQALDCWHWAAAPGHLVAGREDLVGAQAPVPDQADHLAGKVSYLRPQGGSPRWECRRRSASPAGSQWLTCCERCHFRHDVPAGARCAGHWALRHRFHGSSGPSRPTSVGLLCLDSGLLRVVCMRTDDRLILPARTQVGDSFGSTIALTMWAHNIGHRWPGYETALGCRSSGNASTDPAALVNTDTAVMVSHGRRGITDKAEGRRPA